MNINNLKGIFAIPKEVDNNIKKAKYILNKLGIEAYYTNYSETDYGISVYFKDDNNQKIRVSDHGISNRERMSNELDFYFDDQYINGTYKDNSKINTILYENYLKNNKILGIKNKQMTKAQKDNRARFKFAQVEAKKLRAKDPKLTQAMAVKKAFANMTTTPAVKIGAVKKMPVSKHKDTNSHNVAIKIVSGINNTILDDIKAANKKLMIFEREIINHKLFIKNPANKIYHPQVKKQLIGIQKYVKELKTNIKELKKLI